MKNSTSTVKGHTVHSVFSGCHHNDKLSVSVGDILHIRETVFTWDYHGYWEVVDFRGVDGGVTLHRVYKNNFSKRRAWHVKNNRIIISRSLVHGLNFEEK